MNALFSRLNTVVQNVDTVIRRFGRVPVFLITLWAFALYWGERNVFETSAAACSWDRWETWPTTSTPHHVLFIADPQLVDPHTYPGRPWPLSTLTVLYTDLYLKRSYRYLLDTLHPDTTLFLGDLFDGGREWGATSYKSPEKRYTGYGNKFWLREYRRFMNIFIQGWHDRGLAVRPSKGGRRLIASLPGNHDLGFAAGIDPQVKSRFDAHFGPLNRVDVIGNHSFVSIDSVSLSAMDQIDVQTGSSGAGDGSAVATASSKIWTPVEQFLQEAKSIRAHRVKQECRMLEAFSDETSLFGKKPKFIPEVYEIENIPSSNNVLQKDSLSVSSSHFPTIVLSHVPFYRPADTSCGPFREHGHAISISAGYQYQNVLTPLISKDIVEHLDAEQITMMYSGDDHDYCEIEHGEFTGRIREITVKSMSWAMGIRKPGVQLASLWNPIDLAAIAKGEAASDVSVPRGTVQNHLCLLPDQLGIFIRYTQLLLLTLAILLARALWHRPLSQHPHSKQTFAESFAPLLPLSRKITPPPSPSLQPSSYHNRNNPSPTDTSTSSSTSSSRSSTAARSSSKLGGYGNLPASTRSASPGIVAGGQGQSTDDWGMPMEHKAHGGGANNRYRATTTSEMRNRSRTKMQEFKRSVLTVAVPVLTLYAWLIWNG